MKTARAEAVSPTPQAAAGTLNVREPSARAAGVHREAQVEGGAPWSAHAKLAPAGSEVKVRVTESTLIVPTGVEVMGVLEGRPFARAATPPPMNRRRPRTVGANDRIRRRRLNRERLMYPIIGSYLPILE